MNVDLLNVQNGRLHEEQIQKVYSTNYFPDYMKIPPKRVSKSLAKHIHFVN